MYAPTVMPLNGRIEWKPLGIIPLLPLNFGRPIGRPKQAIRIERDEDAEITKEKQKSKEKVIKKWTWNA